MRQKERMYGSLGYTKENIKEADRVRNAFKRSTLLRAITTRHRALSSRALFLSHFTLKNIRVLFDEELKFLSCILGFMY